MRAALERKMPFTRIKEKWQKEMFLGSGTTLIAAEKVERTCFGMEIDPTYADVIVKRYATWCENPVIKLNGVDVTKEWTQ